MSKDTSDTNEFMERVGQNAGYKSTDKHVLAIGNQATLYAAKPKREAEEIIPGAPVQYALMGNKYLPIGATVGGLPPGIYQPEVTQSGVTLARQPLITDDLVRLPDTVTDTVLTEITSFWAMKDEFHKYGFSHKRGYMLYGPPGSGKTSTIALVIEEMVKRGGVVIVAGNCDTEVLAIGLKLFRQVEPERPAVVVYEDIDAIIRRYGESNLLALLDGEYSINNVTNLATTNYPELLDPRIVNRPSRFDRIVKVDLPSKEARLMYLKNRDPIISDEELNHWVSLTEGLSVAHLKELIIAVRCFKRGLDETIDRLRAMAKAPSSDDGRKPVGFGG
jgi:hypothetical protein